MSKRDRKLNILQLLGQKSYALSVAEIKEELDLSFHPKTILRYLNELIDEGHIEKSGVRKNSKYLVTRARNSALSPCSSCFSSASMVHIEKTKQALYERKPISYQEDFIEMYSPNKSSYLPPHIKHQLHQAGLRSQVEDPAGTYAHQIFNRLLIDLSYNSSRLEGNTYSLLETERLLLHGKAAEDKLDEEKVMILNHKEAIRYLVEQASKIQIDTNTIFTLHYLLADGLLEFKYAGKVRDYPVRISGSTYLPLETSHQIQKNFQKLIQKAFEIKDPFEQSFFLLVHLSYLQAFADVNKRTARLAANISLIKQNLVPLSFNDVHLEDYRSAIISIYEFQELQPLVDLYTYSYMRTCSAYDATVKSMGYDEIRVRYRAERRQMIREIILIEMSRDTALEFIKKELQNYPDSIFEDFLEDIIEDLDHIDTAHLYSLGITLKDLSKWQGLWD